ncbi:sigma-54-dependent Fis family transcriptional regulator [Variovorax sp. VNK109]|uniref:sigma-54-dependent Fis family transcriptional regulator n=1 Tax=Variovorax sp. VNK109 TaxID=3400919 RepID=UPI003BFB79A0
MEQLAMNAAPQQVAADRLALIEQARHAVLQDGASTDTRVAPWIAQSWQRCLASGQTPSQEVAFDVVSAQAMRHTSEANRPLVEAARPVLERLAHAIANTRYFAILTDAHGTVVDTHGVIDRNDRRASMIARVGVDLSERSVGTTAISAALSERMPVWLHRGEHFFQDTSIYSCAGAPLMGPDGQCAGMLDLTGIEVPERPELKHLVTQSARSIENALVLGQPHAVLLRLNWPGRDMGGESDGLLALDEDGFVTGSNPVARQMLPQPVLMQAGRLHCSDLFAMPWELLFDAARRAQVGTEAAPQDVPLWSGLRLQALALPRDDKHGMHGPTRKAVPLRDAEHAWIRKAVDDARGNVAEAARVLGISRATVYRKLGQKPRS